MARPGRLWWLVGLVGVLAFAALRVWNPESSGFRICVFRALLDLPCPGCGLTRAMSHLARGSLGQSLDLHPLGPVLALEAGVVWAAWGVLGGSRLKSAVGTHAEALTVVHAVPLLALWLGRAATGTLPF